MAKRDVSIEENDTIKKIMKELAGYNIERAEVILKEVAAQIKERAVIE